MATNVLGKVYETLLCSPGMNEAVKIDVKVNRKTILLLNSVIERGLAAKEGQSIQGFLDLFPKEAIQELKTFSDDCLNKAGLKELSEKMNELA
jgi:hypothetical protein